MWNMKTIVIPAVIGNLGMIRKTNDKWIKQLPGTPHIEMLQKITLLGMAHILGKLLSIKQCSQGRKSNFFSGGCTLEGPSFHKRA